MNRNRLKAIMHYKPYDRLPLIHFGFWHETLDKWAEEGHIRKEEATSWGDGNVSDLTITEKLGFDFNYASVFRPAARLFPAFEGKIVKKLPDGSTHLLNGEGVLVLQHPDAGSIPVEIEHTLTDRASWEENYKWRYQWEKERISSSLVRTEETFVRFDQGGLEFLREDKHDFPYGLHCGSLYGQIRNILGVVGSSYLLVDDEELLDEIIDTIADLCYQNVKYTLETGAKFDFAHFWEDICFKNGPLIAPDVFEEKVGAHYLRITKLLKQHGIDIVSLDCDGKIDTLLPIWLKNGVNTMFPIEVGTWDASIAPWREQYGCELRGIGGMNKTVFSQNHAAVDAEIKRLMKLVTLGGFIPCPDHRIAPDAKWELVSYYTKTMREWS